MRRTKCFTDCFLQIKNTISGVGNAIIKSAVGGNSVPKDRLANKQEEEKRERNVP